MVLAALSTFISETVPTRYYAPSVATLVVLVLTYAYTQGRKTRRDRDLHARTILLTGAFTPLGLNLLEHLAKKGARVIVLLSTPSLTSVQNEILSLLRTTSSNEFIYAEPCQLESPRAIKEFCQKFIAADSDQARRIDALILTHEYSHIGRWKTGYSDRTKLDDTSSMATFLLITLLLPAMLMAPADRDIRIINVVNPFYAAGSKNMNSKPVSISLKRDNDTLSSAGHRALRTVIFTRHLQRILDALPSSAGANIKNQKSNIMAVTVSPGVSRDTVASLLLPFSNLRNASVSALWHWVGAISYVVFLPLLCLFTKSPHSSMQSILHVLCVPRPLVRNQITILEDFAQVREQDGNTSVIGKEQGDDAAKEVLVPGALYAECSVVRLSLGDDEAMTSSRGDRVSDVARLGLGDEKLGRTVWEDWEEAVKNWEIEENSRL